MLEHQMLALGENVEIADNIRAEILKAVAVVRGELILQAGGGEA